MFPTKNITMNDALINALIGKEVFGLEVHSARAEVDMGSGMLKVVHTYSSSSQASTKYYYAPASPTHCQCANLGKIYPKAVEDGDKGYIDFIASQRKQLIYYGSHNAHCMELLPDYSNNLELACRVEEKVFETVRPVDYLSKLYALIREHIEASGVVAHVPILEAIRASAKIRCVAALRAVGVEADLPRASEQGLSVVKIPLQGNPQVTAKYS